MHEASLETLLTVNHHRPISSGNTWLVPSEESTVLRLSESLPRRKSLESLSQVGLTTIRVRHSDNQNQPEHTGSQCVKRAAIKHPRLLAPAFETRSIIAFRLTLTPQKGRSALANELADSAT